MLDKKKIKEKLEAEKDILVEQMRDMGKLNPETRKKHQSAGASRAGGIFGNQILVRNIY